MYSEPVMQPIHETSLANYFREQIAQYAQRLRPPPHEDTCWYLGTVLERFCRSERLFVQSEDGRAMLRPLALLYQDAQEAANERERCRTLQHLGDMALFMGALFPGRYARFGIQRDYFIGMGGGAYQYLAENSRQSRHIFGELASTFISMLTLVSQACTRDQPVSHEDILQVYQRWLDSGDAVAARQLRAIGIVLDDQAGMQ